MINMKYLLYLMLILSFSACTDFPPGVEASLKMAGKNKKELKKVLHHYKKSKQIH